MYITAKITGIKYKPTMCAALPILTLTDLKNEFPRKSRFILQVTPKTEVAISQWTSAKRSRTYPYARIYDTLSYNGKKVTIIPIFKDESIHGDRDYLQWDTVSLMSLLGVYVIVGYYKTAKVSSKNQYKITSQKFDSTYIITQLHKLANWHSDALHWNLDQLNGAAEICKKALNAYQKISRKLNIKLHSDDSAEKRIKELLKGKDNFMKLSRKLSEQAQYAESMTSHLGENLTGKKARLTIKNYLGGFYHFTVDEAHIEGRMVSLVEGKNRKSASLPSIEDIKDGFVKLMIIKNLKNVKANSISVKSRGILKLTSNIPFSRNDLKPSSMKLLRNLKVESSQNKFLITINGRSIKEFLSK